MWKLLRGVVIFFMLPIVLLTWLPANRMLIDGPTYSWGLPFLGMQLSGSSLNFDWVIIFVFNLLAITALVLGFVGSRKSFGRIATIYLGFWFITLIIFIINNNEQLMLRGDTLDVDINLSIVLSVYLLLALFSAMLLAFRAPDATGLYRFGPINRLLLTITILVWIVAAVLLRVGGFQSTTDVWGVSILCSVLIWLVLSLIPWHKPISTDEN